MKWYTTNKVIISVNFAMAGVAAMHVDWLQHRHAIMFCLCAVAVFHGCLCQWLLCVEKSLQLRVEAMEQANRQEAIRRQNAARDRRRQQQSHTRAAIDESETYGGPTCP